MRKVMNWTGNRNVPKILWRPIGHKRLSREGVISQARHNPLIYYFAIARKSVTHTFQAQLRFPAISPEIPVGDLAYGAT